jgi:hypothetical protein
MNHFRIIEINAVDEDEATEPVELSVVKKWLKITFTDDDSVITTLITDARKTIEEYCSISLVLKEITAIIELYPANNRSRIEVELPYGPINPETVADITVQLMKCDGTGSYDTMTLNEDYYFIGTAFPKLVVKVPGVYKITYGAGYATVPSKAIDAMQSEIAYQYENRGDENKAGISEMAKRKAQPLKRFAWL